MRTTQNIKRYNYKVYMQTKKACDMVYPNSLIRIKKDEDIIYYWRLYSGFDIETTTTPLHNGYMYIWSMSINNDVIYGRTWESFILFIKWLQDILELRENRRIIIWVANLGFEFQYIRKHFNITSIFAKEVRQPLEVVIDDCIELRECLSISGGNLASLARAYCTTQKLVGDLDYNKQRNNKTPLTSKEVDYTVNDVVILSEFSRYIFHNFIEKEHYIPLTKTGLLRRQVRKGATYLAKQAVYDCYPTYEQYNEWMLYLFRGGYVHANIFYCDEKIEGVTSYDITSSYPSRMNLTYYPVSRFSKRNNSDMLEYINTHCCIMCIEFNELKAVTPHTIESLSKVKEISPEKIIENGRIRYAKRVKVWLTELDYKVYNMFYTWKSYSVSVLYVAKRGRLPDYVIKPMNIAYTDKDKLKRDGKQDTTEYALAKNYLNSSYGMLVTRLVIREITYNNDSDEWGYNNEVFDYEEEKAKAFLLPQWGVYVTAHARFSVLSVIYKIEKRAIKMGIKKGCVCYCDTDSIKMINAEYFKDIIQNYNDIIDEQIRRLCIEKELDYNIFNNLGKYDLEYKNYTCKFLGAKRYITTDKDGKTKVTIAGLPKTSLQTYCKENNLDIYDVFTHGMLISATYAMKNASRYNDKPHSEIIDGVIMSELSSVGIYPITFELKLDKLFLMDIIARKGENAKYEKRIY